MISDLRLFNFRSYNEAAFEFSDGVNIIVGPNASGKTNLLEAVLVLCSGGSYRAKDVDLISFTQPWTRLESDTDEGVRKVTIERIENAGHSYSPINQSSAPASTMAKVTTKKKFLVQGSQLSRLTLNRKIPVVVFEPEHLRLLSGGPERRRDYLDTLLGQTTPGYDKLLRDYRRTVAQRNSLLKSMITNDNSQLFAWNIRLSELGGVIAAYRQRIVAELGETVEELYNQLAQHKAKVSLHYQTDCAVDNYSSNVLKLLEQNLEKDRLRGFTTNGPHRHDLVVQLNGHPASLTASRGESRTLLLTLKLLELAIVERVRDKKPLLLLDDVFSELDGARRKALTKYLENHQTFITTTDADIVVQHFMQDCTIIPLG